MGTEGRDAPHDAAAAADRLVVRPGGVADVRRLAELLAAGTLVEPEDADDLAPYERAMQEIVVTAGTDVLVAEVGGVVVGMCQVIAFRHLQARGGRCAEIESMHVDTSFRSRGLGGALLDAAVAWARDRGCYRVQLTSHKARVDAHRFYRSHGFIATHEGFKLELP